MINKHKITVKLLIDHLALLLFCVFKITFFVDVTIYIE